MALATAPLRLAIVNDYAVVVAGVAALLDPERIRVVVVETATRMSVLSDVDLVLYDTFGRVQGIGLDLVDFVRDSGGAKVVIFSWNVRPQMITQAMKAGASGYLSKALTGPQIVSALERIMRGETLTLVGDGETSVDGAGDFPGRLAGLSSREAEIIALIAKGLSNDDIAQRAFLGINTIKTYIRTAYRKMGVNSRTQAVLWAIANGYDADELRYRDPALLLRPPL